MPVLIFEHSHATIKAEEILRSCGFQIEITPTPKEGSAECGMSILVKKEYLKKRFQF